MTIRKGGKVRKMNPKEFLLFLLGMGFLFPTLMGIMLGLLAFVNLPGVSNSYFENPLQTEGTVVNLIPGNKRGSFKPEVEYRVEGKVYRLTDTLFNLPAKHNFGDKVIVFYHPENPQEAWLKNKEEYVKDANDGAIRTFLIGGILILGAFAGLGATLYWWFRRRVR